MHNKLVGAYLKKSIDDESAVLGNITTLDTFAVVIAIILAAAGLFAMSLNVATGIAILLIACLNYAVAKFLTGIGRLLVNIQRSNNITMLNTAKFDTAEFVDMLNKSAELQNETKNEVSNSSGFNFSK